MHPIISLIWFLLISVSAIDYSQPQDDGHDVVYTNPFDYEKSAIDGTLDSPDHSYQYDLADPNHRVFKVFRHEEQFINYHSNPYLKRSHTEDESSHNTYSKRSNYQYDSQKYKVYNAKEPTTPAHYDVYHHEQTNSASTHNGEHHANENASLVNHKDQKNNLAHIKYTHQQPENPSLPTHKYNQHNKPVTYSRHKSEPQSNKKSDHYKMTDGIPDHSTVSNHHYESPAHAIRQCKSATHS
ncbi:hypothetical protein BATDEDRAFT_35951, partial [Batrachochytrium dendrobatidis JAM81]